MLNAEVCLIVFEGLGSELYPGTEWSVQRTRPISFF